MSVADCSEPATEAPVSSFVIAQDEDGHAGTLLSNLPLPRPALTLTDTDGHPYDLQADTDVVTVEVAQG
ncbi:hypothetical protein [Modestobacter altitudinis]|uniref:hypothetical protein n=1 Tax=Modestobacter altitudinis TaxID=2213158 RepID=UPI00110C937B|nr:hypothetical protein [Modestobacter altitudinis]